MAILQDNTKILSEGIRHHWRLFLVEGLVLVVLGVGAVLIPVFASLATAVFLGWLFLVGGVVGLVTTFKGRGAPGFAWSLISALITIIAGAILVAWPVGGAISLVLVLAAYLAVDGILSILFAIDHRRELSQRWGWLLANGVLDLVLAGAIVVLPLAAVWALGLLIGIDFIFGGTSLIAMALAARKA